jgi:hypothetical protein
VSFRHDIRACQKYADACARIAARAADAKTRDDFLRLEQSWLRLGRCLAFAARVPNLSTSPPTQPLAAFRHPGP